MDFLSADDLAEVMRLVWPEPHGGLEPTASGDCTKEEAVAWFRACGPQKVMSLMDRIMFSTLPDVITVYRGESGPEALLEEEREEEAEEELDPAEALSWTINPIAAMENPECSRFGAAFNGGGYRACIKKEDVLAYFYRHDMEIVLDPDKLFYLERIEPMGRVLSDRNQMREIHRQERLYQEYFTAEIFRALREKLEPLGRMDELLEATADPDKRDALSKEFHVVETLIY